MGKQRESNSTNAKIENHFPPSKKYFMKTLFARLTAVAAIFTLLIFLFTACTKEDKPAPAIPPANSLIMDFTKFPADEGKTTEEAATKANFGYAAVNVGWWNTVLVVNLAIPVAAFLESFNHDAVYDVATEKWTWSYNFNAAGWHTARLEATMAAEGKIDPRDLGLFQLADDPETAARYIIDNRAR